MRRLFEFLIQAYGEEQAEAVLDAIVLTAAVTIMVSIFLI